VRAWVLVVALALTACGKPTKQADLASCELKAMEVYPHQKGNDGAWEAAADYAFLCMEAKGYVRLTSQSPDCLGSEAFVQEVSPGCYRKPWPWENLREALN
jgi:hypothetical protein